MNSHNAKHTHTTHARNCWPAKRAQFLVYIYMYIYIYIYIYILEIWPTLQATISTMSRVGVLGVMGIRVER